MTELAITPKWKDKEAKFRGVVAAGEHVAVTIQNDDGSGNAFISDTETLRLNVIDPTSGRLLATFPTPVEDGETPETWSESGTQLSCELNLNTVQMLKAVLPASVASLLFVLDDYENKTLYFKAQHEVAHWPRRRGEEEPLNLDGYKDIIRVFGLRLTAVEETATSAAASAASAATSSATSAQAAEAAAAAIDETGKAISAEVKRAQDAETALAGRIKELEENRSVEVVAPSPDGAGKAADAKAVYDALVNKADKGDITPTGETAVGENIYANSQILTSAGSFYNIWSGCVLWLPWVTRKEVTPIPGYTSDNSNFKGVPIRFFVRIAAGNFDLSDVIFFEGTGRRIVTNVSENSFSGSVSAKSLGLDKKWRSITVSVIPTDVDTEFVHLEVV